MIITDHFVFVHMPKTGGSFVSDVLRRLHRTGWLHNLLLRHEPLLVAKNRLLKTIRGGKIAHEEFNKHGTCHDIPPEVRHLSILSCMRNPYDWYVSNYKYAWWLSHPQDYPELRNDPRWPNLTFTDYLQLSHRRWIKLLNPELDINQTLGRLTVLFINYYCRHPEKILSLQSENEILTAVHADMFPVSFLDTHNLNRELYQYLLKTRKYSAQNLAFILDKPKISPRKQRQSHETWPSFYTSEQKADVRYRDRILFELFPQYNS